MFLLVSVAECCSFVATLTLDKLFFAFEESLWGLAYLITWPSFLHLFLSARRIRLAEGSGIGRSSVELLSLAASILFLFYVPWGAFVDVPSYVDMYKTQIQHGFKFFSIADGVQDAWSTRIVTHSWDAWGPALGYMFWRMAYFGPTVWVCILLVFAPRLPSCEKEKHAVQCCAKEQDVV